jgi:aldose 1-epimerase
VTLTRRPVHAVEADDHPIDFETIDVDLGTLRIQLLTLGAAIRTVEVPDAQGVMGHVHLHLPTPEEHADRSRNPHLGGTLGRYANRISRARFILDGKEYRLDSNKDGNTLHGGTRGFDRCVWDVIDIAQNDDLATITMELTSPDGDMGFPGTVVAQTTYEISPDSITMTYSAVTDAPTVISMANHGYWNLAGSSSIAAHFLQVPATRRLVTDDTGIPVGIDEVADTLFDLRRSRQLAPVIETTGGLDTCYLPEGEGLRVMAELSAPGVGRRMRVSSDAPGLQVYTGNGLGEPFHVHQSVSLEAQRAPDAPNQPELGECVLRPGHRYSATTIVDFSPH